MRALFDFSDIDAARDAAERDARRIETLEDSVTWLAQHGIEWASHQFECGVVFGDQGCAIEDLVSIVDAEYIASLGVPEREE